jgi:glycosyltransferase involved in cell wall biosynthesis
MSVLVDGTSVITAGLDHWFPKDNTDLALEDFTVHDWRLEARLNVKEFRLPPDWRSGSGADRRNVRLSVPALRFPGYAFCMYCKRLKEVPLSFQDVVRCEDRAHAGGKGKGPRMSQVPFVALCEDGHIDDFPFREEKEDFLLWIGRMSPDKGPHRAITAGCRSISPFHTRRASS